MPRKFDVPQTRDYIEVEVDSDVVFDAFGYDNIDINCPMCHQYFTFDLTESEMECPHCHTLIELEVGEASASVDLYFKQTLTKGARDYLAGKDRA